MTQLAEQVMNIMIVDDEPIIRIGLRTLVEWESHGFRLVAEASDGEEALGLMAQQPVDLLVTDIRMPRMDGLELIRQTRLSNEDIGIVVLSCLDDFSFVKEAMKLGARDYILKPTMEPDSLVETLKSISSTLLEERSERAQLQVLSERLEQSRAYRLQATLRAYLEQGQYVEELTSELCRADRKLYTLHILLPLHMNIASLDAALSDILVAVRLQDNGYLLLLDCERALSTNEWYQLAHSTAEGIILQLAKSRGRDSQTEQYPVIFVGPPIHNLSELPDRIDYHREQAHWRYYSGSNNPIYMDAPLPRTIGDLSPAAESRNNLLRAIAGGNPEAVRHHLGELLTMIEQSKPELPKLHAYIFETASLIIGYAREHHYLNIGELEQKYVSLETIAGKLLFKDLYWHMIDFTRELFDRQDVIRTRQAENMHPFIRKAIAFIRGHYMENIGTADIAEHVKLSRSYLSDLYSKEAGESLIETLARVRIEEACRLLLSTDLKVYEVAEAVGFNDSKTFTKSFKRQLGCSPKEYCQSNK